MIYWMVLEMADNFIVIEINLDSGQWSIAGTTRSEARAILGRNQG